MHSIQGQRMCLKHRLVLGGSDTHATTQPGGKPKAMEEQHTGSFPWARSDGAASSPWPSPRLGRCPSALPGGRGLLSQAVAGALSCCWAGFLPHPLLLLSLLCSSGSFPALKVEDRRRPGGGQRAAPGPVFSEGAPAFKAAAAFPRPAQVLRAPVHTAGSHNNPRPIRRTINGAAGGGPGTLRAAQLLGVWGG